MSLLVTFLVSHTQVKSNFRSSITIPEKSWVRFRDVFNDYVEKMGDAAERSDHHKAANPQSRESGDAGNSSTNTGASASSK